MASQHNHWTQSPNALRLINVYHLPKKGERNLTQDEEKFIKANQADYDQMMKQFKDAENLIEDIQDQDIPQMLIHIVDLQEHIETELKYDGPTNVFDAFVKKVANHKQKSKSCKCENDTHVKRLKDNLKETFLNPVIFFKSDLSGYRSSIQAIKEAIELYKLDTCFCQNCGEYKNFMLRLQSLMDIVDYNGFNVGTIKENLDMFNLFFCDFYHYIERWEKHEMSFSERVSEGTKKVFDKTVGRMFRLYTSAD